MSDNDMILVAAAIVALLWLRGRKSVGAEIGDDEGGLPVFSQDNPPNIDTTGLAPGTAIGRTAAGHIIRVPRHGRPRTEQAKGGGPPGASIDTAAPTAADLEVMDPYAAPYSPGTTAARFAAGVINSFAPGTVK